MYIYRYYNIYYLVCAYTQAHEMGEWDIKSFSDLILLYYCKRHRSYTATISNVGTTIRARVCGQHTDTHIRIYIIRTHAYTEMIKQWISTCVYIFFFFVFVVIIPIEFSILYYIMMVNLTTCRRRRVLFPVTYRKIN